MKKKKKPKRWFPPYGPRKEAARWLGIPLRDRHCRGRRRSVDPVQWHMWLCRAPQRRCRGAAYLMNQSRPTSLGTRAVTWERNKLMATGSGDARSSPKKVRDSKKKKKNNAIWGVLDTWIRWWDTPCRCCTWPGAWQSPRQPPGAGRAATPWTGAPVASSLERAPLRSQVYY